MKLKRVLLGVVLLVFVITQFMLNKSNISSYESVTVFEKAAGVNKSLSTILKNNCYDCHSNHTNYGWYGSIGVINIFQSHHIEEGKEHLDFSSWSTYNEGKRKHKIEEIYEEVEEDHMPITMYKFIHGGLNPNEKKELLAWAKSIK